MGHFRVKKNSRFQNETKCKTFDVKMRFTYMRKGKKIISVIIIIVLIINYY